MIEISEVRSWLDRERFIRFPWRIYKGDPNWCPPLLQDRRFFNSKKHPFMRHGTAARFLARRDGEIVGRIAVSEDPRLNSTAREKIACVGQFECIDDQAVADALFQAAKTWAKGRALEKLRGPVDYSTNYNAGLLIGPFTMPQRIQMAHNPPYYERLFTNSGFQKAKDLFSWWGEKTERIERWRKKVERLEHLSPVKIRPFNLKERERDVAMIKNLALKLLESNWANVEMSDVEFDHFVKDMKLVPPDLILIAEEDGKAVGLSFTVPDFNEALRPLNGRLLPFGFLKFMLNLKKIKTARMAILGVAPDYRYQAIAERMILKTFDSGRHKYKFTSAEMGWTVEDNQAMIASVDAVSSEYKKIYRVYELELSVQ